MSNLAWMTNRPIAHRGLHDGNKAVWENTLAAFALAIAGNFAIETDVHLTKDGVAVIFHDGDLKRLTGREGFARDHTAAEMCAMNIGGTAEKVPTLRQLLELVAGQVPVIIELKGDAGFDGGLVAAVAADLATYKGHAAIMSFDHHLIREFAKVAPKVPGGLTAEGTSVADIEANFSMLAHEISFVSYNVHHLPNAFTTFVRERLEMPVITWTVRTKDDFERTYANADQATFELCNPDRLLEK
jgi:glycerophosphoryl diester phosphodiesterase